MRKIYFLTALLFLHGCEYGNGISAVEEQPKAEYASPRPAQPDGKMKKTASAEALRDTGRILKQDSPPPRAMLDVIQINQNPELKYGCEVTSLAMVLNHAGVRVGKMELYRAVKKDHDQLMKNGRDIVRWGDPAEGFVGDMTGRSAGYAVFDKPIEDLVNSYLPGRAVNLTGRPFEEILAHVGNGYPVVVWTTGDFRLPDRWETWLHGGRTIRTPLDLHAVVLVGYDRNFVYINDPLSEKKQFRIDKEQFYSSWKALKCRAVSYH